MDNLTRSTAADLAVEINEACIRLDIAGLAQQLDQTRSIQQTDFWNDSGRAQDVMKQIAKLETRTEPWLRLQSTCQEVTELLQLKDESLEAEIKDHIAGLRASFDILKEDLKFNGPYDDHDVILSIHAGMGGTDAQDWAQMLLRMYTRYCEKNGWKTTMVDESAGEEAGIKSVTLEIEGSYKNMGLANGLLSNCII